ncbi:MAG: hypothetical protein FGM46_02580 [Ferruginibacter sp.]|nr:hypothetical protein [Ferruginibacter sp.]
MIVIVSDTKSNRLNYICNFLFREQLGLEYIIRNDIHHQHIEEGSYLFNYTEKKIESEAFRLKPVGLLTEKNIRKQHINVFEKKEYKAFFKIEDSDFDFDILSAIFFLISRYEEYLPHEKDMYGRFSHDQSVAYKNDFLHLPLVNSWLNDFADCLQKKIPFLKITRPPFEYIPTYDVDMAWSFKKKGVLRNIGGFISSPSLQRIRVVLGKEKDPFDCYEFLDDLHHKKNLAPVYFFLTAEQRGKYDKNISPHKRSMKRLIKKISENSRIGIHPSWKSNETVSILKREKKILEIISQQSVVLSRQHYIKLKLPHTFENLIEAGITEDYSMGYGSINGFRASVASSFLWYNLEKEEETSLRLFPFCFMDANAHFEQKQNAEISFDELMRYYQVCKEANGMFITIFHNYMLGTDKHFEGWKNLYQHFIAQIRQ